MKLSIIIPAYNEQETILEIIQKVQAAALPAGISKEIIVVNDGSGDETSNLLKSLPAHAGLKVFHQHNQGKTAALLMGMEASSGSIILIQDADFEYDPNEYAKLLAPIVEGRSRVVYGSRFLGTIKGMALINRFANVASNWTFRLLYGVNLTDINTCYKVFTRQAIAGINITSQHFAFETEMTVKLLRRGETIQEVPITYTARTREQGKKIRWSTALEMYWPIIKYRFKR